MIKHQKKDYGDEMDLTDKDNDVIDIFENND